MITVNKQPDKISPVFSNFNKFEFTEPNATYFNIEITGGATGKYKVYPNLSNVAEFNIRYLLESFITSQIALPTMSVLPNALLSYDIKITSSLATVLTLTGFKFFNGALQDNEQNKAAEGFILNNAYSQDNKLVSYFNGTTSKLTFTSLAGVNIVGYEGTTTLSIVGNEIVGTKGTCYNLRLSNGDFYALPHKGEGVTDVIELGFNNVINFAAQINFNEIIHY